MWLDGVENGGGTGAEYDSCSAYVGLVGVGKVLPGCVGGGEGLPPGENFLKSASSGFSSRGRAGMLLVMVSAGRANCAMRSPMLAKSVMLRLTS